jgi:hypothetical protein
MKSGKRITKDIKILWHCGYYDGVLSGVCDLGGKKHWFTLLKDSANRTFKVYSLSEENEKALCYWHKIFSETVNPNTEYEYSEQCGRFVRTTKEFIFDSNFAQDFYYQRYLDYTKKIGSWSLVLEVEDNLVGTVTEKVLLGFKKTEK